MKSDVGGSAAAPDDRMPAEGEARTDPARREIRDRRGRRCRQGRVPAIREGDIRGKQRSPLAFSFIGFRGVSRVSGASTIRARVAWHWRERPRAARRTPRGDAQGLFGCNELRLLGG